MDKFIEGQIVWDTQFKEVFPFDPARDRMIFDRLEKYSHQDEDFSNMCDFKFCQCHE